MMKDKKKLITMTIAVATLLLLVIGATYAYFAANLGNGTNASINASTATTDSLSFSVGKDIEIKATMDNFRPGMEDLHGETTATATLKANSLTNNATARYNVFFIIDNNNFEYTTEDAQTELLLKVTDPNGNEVENITGLKRVEGGFDITTRTGGFLIMADYDIAATTAENLKSQTWKLEITYINLEANQNKNKGKTLNGRFYITTDQESTYEPVEINSIETDTSPNSITANLTSLAGTADIEKYYYAIEEVTSGVAYLGAGISVARLSNELAIADTDYIESDEPTHTFTNLKPSTKYKVYSYAVDKNKIKSNVYITEVTTAEYFMPIIDSVTTSNTTTSITVNVSSQSGTVGIDKYYYSIDDGSLIESNDASHTFTGLAANTSHTIRIKAVDTNGVESEVYTLIAKTVTLASITDVTTSVTSSSVTVNVTATKGDANIASYYYSKDNGVTWSEATPNSSYTFNDLDSNTTYQIKVKVVDTEGRESSEAAATAKTDYVLASITNVTHNTTLNSITVNVTAQAGSNSVVKYYYSKDNGSTYEESDNSSHTFSDLLDTTEYKIKIKVKDSDGQYSTEYYESIATVTYINPSVTTVSSDKTYNSISLTTTAAGGTNSVANYYYKVGTDPWSEAQTTNTYNITGLSENTKYTIKVKVEDSNERFSNEYTLDVTTNTYTIPSVSATTSKTSNSITIDATGTNGDGTIAKYMYSKDGGSNWITQNNTSTSDSYTFESLTPNVEYQIRVKVVDNNDRESSEYSTGVTTDKGNFTNNTTSDATGTYDGSSKTITVSISPTPTTIYYSSTTELNTSNYSSSGSTTKPTRTEAGTTTVYWCAVKNGYNTYCSSNTITISKATPTLTVSSTTSTIESSVTTSSVTYTYTGDGTVSCKAKSPSTATYASCSINTSTKTITFTKIAAGTQTFTISAAAGANYSAATSQTITVTVKNQTLAMVCEGKDMATCFKNNYTLDDKIYYHSNTLANSAGDNSYRYAGYNPKNYVCFGSDAATCPRNSLYRIIGIFDNKIKIQANEFIDVEWNTSSSNTWNYSTIQSALANKYSSLPSAAKAKVVQNTWYVGGGAKTNLLNSPVKTAYDYEVGANRANESINDYYGLMYLSDVYYSASPYNWTKYGVDPTAYGNQSYKDVDNWLGISYMGYEVEYTMSRNTDNTTEIFGVVGTSSGNYISSLKINNCVVGYVQCSSHAKIVYYISNITLNSGSGTYDDPYRIS